MNAPPPGRKTSRYCVESLQATCAWAPNASANRAIPNRAERQRIPGLLPADLFSSAPYRRSSGIGRGARAARETERQPHGAGAGRGDHVRRIVRAEVDAGESDSADRKDRARDDRHARAKTGEAPEEIRRQHAV